MAVEFPEVAWPTFRLRKYVRGVVVTVKKKKEKEKDVVQRPSVDQRMRQRHSKLCLSLKGHLFGMERRRRMR